MAKGFNLSSLLSDKSKEGKKAKLNGCPRTGFIIQNIYIGDLKPDPNNFYNVDDVVELKESILMFGLQQPLVVRENEDGTYTITSGHRRLKALEMLAEEGFEQFEEVPCKVETPLDEVREELKLILANATSRELTDYEKTHQASRMKELLTILKNSGQKLPGRMRELVAETLNISSTQVARMEAIENKLLPEFKEEFKNENVNITVAYELSGLPKDKQEEAYKRYKDKGALKINDVKILKIEKQQDKPKDEPAKQKEEIKVAEEIKSIQEEEFKPLKIYVCSAYGGLEENYKLALEYCRQVAAKGHIPFASHVMLYKIFNDVEDRERGIAAGLEMIKIVDELWFYGEEITDGMETEREEAKRIGKPVIYKGLGENETEIRKVEYV